MQEIFGEYLTENKSIFHDPQLIHSGFIDAIGELIDARSGYIRSTIIYNAPPTKTQPEKRTIYLQITAQIISFPEEHRLFLYLSTNDLQNIDLFQQLQQNCESLQNLRRNLEDIIISRTSQLEKKNMELQYSAVLSMISSMFLSKEPLDEKISNALRTLGESINCDLILAGSTVCKKDKIDYQLKWSWTSPQSTIKIQPLIDLIQNHYHNPFQSLTPTQTYLQFNVEKMDPRIAHGIEELNLRSFLLIPIITGSKVWGNLMLADAQIRDFDAREISMSLNVAIIIGLSLRNQNNQRFSDMIFDALSKLNIGVFILQNDAENQVLFRYCNDAFSRIVETPKELIHDLSSIGHVFSKEIVMKLFAVYQARQKGERLPMAYRVPLTTKSGSKQVLLTLTTGELNERVATFGFALDLHPEQSPWIDDIYQDLKKL
jgi:GAF domain-containing protein